MTELLTEYGPLGISTAALAAVVVILWRANEKLRDKREEDVKTLLTALAAGSASSDRIADALEEFTNRLPGWITRPRSGSRDPFPPEGGPYR